jgi:hypothetical protein
MDKVEAKAILRSELAKYRDWTYSQLRELIGAPKRAFPVTGRSGAEYQIDIQAFWDSDVGGDVRVMACIDDGGWRAFLPLSDSFIKGPDGSFVGER